MQTIILIKVAEVCGIEFKRLTLIGALVDLCKNFWCIGVSLFSMLDSMY